MRCQCRKHVTLALDVWVLIDALRYRNGDDRTREQLYAAMANYRVLRSERPSFGDMRARLNGWS